MNRVNKELRHMVKKMVHVNHDALTSDEAKANANALAKASMLRVMVRGTRLLNSIQGKKETTD
jgi:hypothetical protein